jgi:hypothetical protein
MAIAKEADFTVVVRVKSRQFTGGGHLEYFTVDSDLLDAKATVEFLLRGAHLALTDKATLHERLNPADLPPIVIEEVDG